jgi:hypothetical protein
VKLGRALRHRNYRLFFAGQGTSLIGTWLTKFAMAYQTYELSHDAFELGLVALHRGAHRSRRVRWPRRSFRSMRSRPPEW